MKRFDIHLVRLDPATGAETAKTRPCVMISPDEASRALETVIIAPMTTMRRNLADPVSSRVRRKAG